MARTFPPRVRTERGCYEQKATGEYRWIRPGGALRERDLGDGYSATPHTKRRRYRWLVSNGTNVAHTAATLTEASSLAQTLAAQGGR